MEEQTFFDYYYGGESEQFAFYRIPRQLVIGSYFKNLSTDAKLHQQVTGLFCKAACTILDAGRICG